MLWCMSAENCDTPVYTAMVCRMEALDVATLSHSLKTLFFRKDWDPQLTRTISALDVYIPAESPNISGHGTISVVRA